MYKSSVTRLVIVAVFILAILSSSSLHAQPRDVPLAYTFPQVSYIRTFDALAPEQDGTNLLTRPLKDVKQATQYLDGLGRPLQTVIRKGSLETDPLNPASSAGARDMVSPVEYDVYGREQFKYLPYAEGSVTDGLFKSNPFIQQEGFMNQQYSSQSEIWFYSQTNFETSPLNRVGKSMAPGNNWVGGPGDGRGVEMKYWNNTLTDDVKKWIVTDVANNWGSYSATGSYPAGELYKMITVDEHGKQVIEFKDKEGKVILKKVQLTGPPDDGSGIPPSGAWLCTYYIYDNFNNLRCVIQPRGVELISPAWVLTDATILAEQCFRYEYDERNRMVMKKVPGAGEVWMVYDARDRLVLSQDANMRNPPLGGQGGWLYTLYDEQNRPSSSGLWNNTQDRITHKGLASTSTSYPNLSGQTIEELTKTFYDNYDWRSSHGNPLSATYNTSYDSYFQTVSNSNWPYPQGNTQSKQLKGLVTGTKIKVLGTSTYLYTVTFYDEKGRVIQMQAQNITTGTDITTTQYTWAGQSLVAVQKQEKAGTNAQTTVMVTQLSYDELGRVIKTEKKQSHTSVNSSAMSAYAVISTLEYDKLGQLKKKTIGSKKDIANNYITPRQPLEELSYDYNIRGWMLGMNRAYLVSAGQSGTNKFGFELAYDKATNQTGQSFTSVPQYNGNIMGMAWKTDGDDVRRIYNFGYDAANRLLKADFIQQNPEDNLWNNSRMNFSVNMGDGSTPVSAYDANGNIKAMTQYGWQIGVSSSTPIDNLTYTYKFNNNSNQLQQVTDANNDNLSKLGDFKYDQTTKTATDYSYDVNGNLTLDNNKKISAITYNHLNLPSLITVTGKGDITYTYDAAGNKLKKEVNETGLPLKTTLYNGGFVYENDVLQFAGHEEGRLRFNVTNNTLQYDYFVKDHLGNVRMVLTEEQQQDQYPASTLEGSTTPGALSMINFEKNFYTVNNTYVVNSTTMPGWNSGKNYQNNNGNPPPNSNYPSGTTPTATVTSAKVYKLNATTNKTGLGMVLKVMAGDKIDIHGKSYYQSSTTYNNSNSTVLSLSDIIGAFTGSPDNAGFASKGITTGTMQTINTGLIPSSFIRGNDGSSSTVPKAYINYIFFDEQFKFAGGNFSRVGSSGTMKSHWFADAQLQNITVPKSGYLYVYVSNESNANVFFDNVQVFHTRGPILEESHYYLFGLKMNGISSKSLNFGDPRNKDKTFQSQQIDDDLGLNWIQFKWRNHDPQIGRFIEIDPLSEKYVYNSTYAFSENKVIAHVELEGLETAESNDPGIRALMNKGVQREMRKTQEYLSNSTKVEITTGPGIGVKVKLGDIGVNAGLSGAQTKVSINLAGQTEVNANLVSVGVAVNTPIGDANAGVLVGGIRVKDGKTSTTFADAGVSIEPKVSKEVKNEKTTAKGEVSGNGEVSVGGHLGFVGLVVTFNPINLFNGIVSGFKTLVEYKKEEVKERTTNPLINKNQNRGPGN